MEFVKFKIKYNKNRPVSPKRFSQADFLLFYLNAGKVFLVKDAVIGENYPIIHPNCRCSVVAMYDSNKNTDVSLDEISLLGESLLHSLSKGPDLTDYLIWLSLLIDNIPQTKHNLLLLSGAYANDFSVIEVDGKNCRFNPNLSQNIAILPNGDIINGDKLNSKDEQLLGLMRLRNSAIDYSQNQAYILAGLNILEDYTPTYIDFFKPYDFYTLTEDVTEALTTLKIN